MSGRRHRKKHENQRPGQRRNRKQVQRIVKDRLFRYLFEKDREALLDLYNALNGTSYQDSSQLEIVTIESAVYVVMKNDLAYILTGTLNMYEHQSTYNRAEVLGMLLEEFDAEKYERTIRVESWEEGIKEGEIKVNRLGILLTEAGRSSDFLKSLSDRELQRELFIEFGLEEGK